ncbi:MAG: glycosyltransferase [Clostridiales Family XIII bacterium]|jgi:glycosyltransferase involved in cell wall biosynthesis|nr:glycosyltransferase [Clostridiales Family XIII bacterium]
MDNLISVVIPCYNVENYIVKCLESVLSQSHGNLEVIVVNDGSTDGTADRIKPYLTDKRVVYMNRPNAGVSAARNAGTDAARGDFLAFADSDDFLAPDMYERLYAAVREAGADTAVCDYNLVYEDRTVTAYSQIRDETTDVYDDVYGYFMKYCACARPNNYIWTRLYKTEIVKKSGVRFEPYRIGDDTLFNFKLLPHIRRVVFVAGGLYNYLQRSDSNVYTFANKGNPAEVYADTFQALADYYRENDCKEFLAVLPIHAFTRLRSVFFYSRLAGQSDDEILSNLASAFKERDIYRYLTGAVS